MYKIRSSPLINSEQHSVIIMPIACFHINKILFKNVFNTGNEVRKINVKLMLHVEKKFKVQ